MNFDTNYNENDFFDLPSIFQENNFKFNDNNFSLEETLPSPNGTCFLEEPHTLENNNNPNKSISSYYTSNLPSTFGENSMNYIENSPIEYFQPSCKVYDINTFDTFARNNGANVSLIDNSNQNKENFGNSQIIDTTTPIHMVNSWIDKSYNPYDICKSVPTKCRSSYEDSYYTNSIVHSSLASNGQKTMIGREGIGYKNKTNNMRKGQWSAEEDRRLCEAVNFYGLRKWSQVAEMVKGRIGKQCRERWYNHLRPNIKKDVWSEEEDQILINLHSKIGNKWAKIAKKLPGRTENTIKNHWNATKRKQLSKRKCRPKNPKQSSLLQEYIKGLPIEKINAGCRPKSSFSSNTNKNTINQPSSKDNNNDATKSSNYSSFTQDYDFSDDLDFSFVNQCLEEGNKNSLQDYAPNDNDKQKEQQGELLYDDFTMDNLPFDLLNTLVEE